MASGGVSSAHLHVVSAKRSRQSRCRRIGESGRLHGLPRRARHPGRRRSEVADQQVQRPRHLRQVPRRRQAANMQGAFTVRHIAARQLAGSGVYGLPRHSHHQGAKGSELFGRRRQREEHVRLRATPACACPTNSACRAIASSSYLASYHGMASKVGSNTVANCASCHGVHNILPSSDPRSTINSRQLGEDLRTVSPWRQREVHYDQSPPGRHQQGRHRVEDNRSDQQVLHVDDRRRDRRHGAAQPDHLPQEADPAPHRTAAHSVPHDADPARPAPDAADELLHPGADRLRVEVSAVVAGGNVRQRAGAQLYPPHRRRGADRRQPVPRVVSSPPTRTAGSCS